MVWEGGLKRSASPPTIRCDPGFDSMNHQGLMEGSKSPAAPPVPLQALSLPNLCFKSQSNTKLMFEFQVLLHNSGLHAGILMAVQA